MSKRKKCPWLSADWQNKLSQFIWLEKLYNIALTRFEWSGLPDYCDERYIELNLLWNGHVVWFEDEEIGLTCLPFVQNSHPDIFGNPSMVAAFSYNGYYRPGLTTENSVLMWDNLGRTPEIPTIEKYASVLGKIDRTIDVNLNNQKQPLLILCDDSEKLTYANALRDYERNEYAILGLKTFSKDSFQILNPNDGTGSFNVDKLINVKRAVWSEALSFLGVETTTREKAERLTQQESALQYGEIEMYRTLHLAPRQAAADKVNELFGTNIEIRYRSDLDLSRLGDIYNPDNPTAALAETAEEQTEVHA